MDLAVVNKNLEFAASLAHWVQVAKIDEPLKKDFLAFIDSQRKRYPNLVEFLESIKALKPSKVEPPYSGIYIHLGA